MTRPYRDRRHAGRVLAQKLGRYAGRKDVVVLALPRGGVPVAYEVARKLGAPLDVLVVRKLGVPFHPELAMGAIASGGVQVLDRSMVGALGIPPDAVQRVVEVQQRELERRETAYRGDAPPVDLTGRVALLAERDHAGLGTDPGPRGRRAGGARRRGDARHPRVLPAPRRADETAHPGEAIPRGGGRGRLAGRIPGQPVRARDGPGSRRGGGARRLP